jgi:hypothetical protein
MKNKHIKTPCDKDPDFRSLEKKQQVDVEWGERSFVRLRKDGYYSEAQKNTVLYKSHFDVKSLVGW